jgi:hypothetical protein
VQVGGDVDARDGSCVKFSSELGPTINLGERGVDGGGEAAPALFRRLLAGSRTLG